MTPAVKEIASTIPTLMAGGLRAVRLLWIKDVVRIERARCCKMTNLPKFLVNKLGIEKVRELYHQPVPEPLPELDTHVIPAPRTDYHIKSYPVGSKLESKQKWREIHFGKRAPDVLYTLDEAIEEAGI